MPKKITWLLLIAFVLLEVSGMNLVQPSKAYAAQVSSSPIGVVDYVYLINQHPDTEKANESLRAEQEVARKEVVEKSAKMSDKDKQDLVLQLGMRIEQKQQELLKPITDSINVAMKAVAEAKGLSVVLFKNTVAFGGPDITEEVLKRINGK